MILPFIFGVKSFFKAPMTWGLVFLNVMFYFASLQRQNFDLHDEYLRRTQGLVFASYISGHKDVYNSFFLELAKQALAGEDDKIDLLCSLAVRDNEFLRNWKSFDYKGDDVAWGKWKAYMQEFQNDLSESASFRWGIRAGQYEPLRWLTYQFVHVGWLHLFSNLWFLLIFGCAIEVLMGPLVLVCIYIASGLAGAAGFLLLTGATAAPLVGASGAISGLMTFLTFILWHRRVMYLFWLLPVRGLFGFIQLPVWCGFSMWFLADLAGYFGTPPELGGVAYAAHLGGSFLGGLFASVFLVWSKSTAQSIFARRPGLHKLK